MSKQISTGNHSRGTQSFGPGDLDLETVEKVAEKHFDSKADLYRTAVSNLLDEYDDEDTDADPHAELHKPENPELREAFEKLLEASNHPQGPRSLTTEEAKSKLHTQKCPKAQVKRRLLMPLSDKGFISAKSGRITVHRRTVEQIEEAEKEAEESLSRLEEATVDGPEFRDVDPTHEELMKWQRAGIDVPFRLTAWVASETLFEGGASA